jgi:serine/threonine-protein kinase
VALLPDGNKVFIKILSRQKDQERRARMYREVSALETLSFAGIPRLIQTNVRHFADPEYKLYFAMEFVSGKTLDDVARLAPVDAEQSLALVTQLCEIVSYCHANDVVHRDIKPDNILLSYAEGEPNRLYLVDFGMVHRDDPALQLTLVEQSVGNRFLILPEFQAGSSNKRDPRSDLAACVGVLFFLLTGEYPVVLADEHGSMPHQRLAASATLRASGLEPAKLLDFFDRGFQQFIDLRYQSAESLREALTRLSLTETIPAQTADSIFSRIREKATSAIETRQLKFVADMRNLSSQLRDFTRKIANEVGESVHFTETGGGASPQDGVMRHKFGFVRATDQGRRFWPEYTVTNVGSEYIVDAREEGAPGLTLRLPVSDPNFDASQLERLKLYLLRGIEVLLS